MKKGLLLGSAMLMAFGMVEAASASLVNFDLAGSAGGSAVTVTDSARRGDLTGALAPGLDSQIFSLNDNETQVVDFFTLTASGTALWAAYDVSAILAFDAPSMAAAYGSGEGHFGTAKIPFFGRVSGGTLSWIQPAELVLAGGNMISVTFEDIPLVVGFSDTAMVHATIKNLGGGTTPTNAPVPEPATMFLFGAGLVSFAGLTLSRKKK